MGSIGGKLVRPKAWWPAARLSSTILLKLVIHQPHRLPGTERRGQNRSPPRGRGSFIPGVSNGPLLTFRKIESRARCVRYHLAPPSDGMAAEGPRALAGAPQRVESAFARRAGRALYRFAGGLSGLAPERSLPHRGSRKVARHFQCRVCVKKGLRPVGTRGKGRPYPAGRPRARECPLFPTRTRGPFFPSA